MNMNQSLSNTSWRDIAPMSANEIQQRLKAETDMAGTAKQIGVTRQLLYYYADGDRTPGMRIAATISQHYRNK